MDNELIIRAWKDPSFRTRLFAPQRATLPESLSGRSITELDDDALGDAVGGWQSRLVVTVARPVIVESTTPETRWT